MPASQFVPVVIPLYFQGHVSRAGSRIRVTIAVPNGTQPVWSFGETQPAGTTATEAIAFSSNMPSSLILRIVPGVSVPTGMHACPSLRNEPCRPYRPFVNNDSLRQEVWRAAGPTPRSGPTRCFAHDELLREMPSWPIVFNA
jgi:hypothetical protein